MNPKDIEKLLSEAGPQVQAMLRAVSSLAIALRDYAQEPDKRQSIEIHARLYRQILSAYQATVTGLAIAGLLEASEKCPDIPIQVLGIKIIEMSREEEIMHSRALHQTMAGYAEFKDVDVMGRFEEALAAQEAQYEGGDQCKH